MRYLTEALPHSVSASGSFPSAEKPRQSVDNVSVDVITSDEATELLSLAVALELIELSCAAASVVLSERLCVVVDVAVRLRFGCAAGVVALLVVVIAAVVVVAIVVGATTVTHSVNLKRSTSIFQRLKKRKFPLTTGTGF